MPKKEKFCEMSGVGCFLHNFEFKICKNIRIFIGRNEKTIEIFFLILFFVLQGILAFYVSDPIVTLIIIIFLLFLSLERIFTHIWLEYDREQLARREDKSKENYSKFKDNTYQHISYLTNEIVRLEERLKKSEK